MFAKGVFFFILLKKKSWRKMFFFFPGFSFFAKEKKLLAKPTFSPIVFSQVFFEEKKLKQKTGHWKAATIAFFAEGKLFFVFCAIQSSPRAFSTAKLNTSPKLCAYTYRLSSAYFRARPCSYSLSIAIDRFSEMTAYF